MFSYSVLYGRRSFSSPSSDGKPIPQRELMSGTIMTAAARWAAQQWERGHPRLATNAWFELRELYCNRVLPSAFVFTR